MLESGLITPQKEFSSSLLKEVYDFTLEIAPNYVLGLQALAEAFSVEMVDKDGRLGFGVFTNFEWLAMASEFTGRGYCNFSSDILSMALKKKFPQLLLRRCSGWAYSYHLSLEVKSEIREGDVRHTWIALADPEKAEFSDLEKSLFFLDGTVRQINPKKPFILFSDRQKGAIFDQLYSRDYQSTKYPPKHFQPDRDWLTFSRLRTKYKQQEACYQDLLRVVGLQ